MHHCTVLSLGDSLFERYFSSLFILPLFLKDLFDNGSNRNGETNNSDQVGSRAETKSNDFHFSLDEDTQFTQILNTQGYVCHSKTLSQFDSFHCHPKRKDSTVEPCLFEPGY